MALRPAHLQVVRYPLLTVFLVASLAGGLVYPVVTIHRTGGAACLSPYNSAAIAVLDDMAAGGFGYGRVNPYAMVFVPRGGGSGSLLTHSNSVITAISAMATAVQAMPNTPRYGVNGLFFANGKLVDTGKLKVCLYTCYDTPFDTTDPVCVECQPYLVAFRMYVAPAGNATWLRVVTASDPSDARGTQWLRDVRRAAADIGAETGVDIHLALGASMAVDMEDAIYSSLPLAAGAMVRDRGGHGSGCLPAGFLCGTPLAVG